jgi:hypothetical protein
VPFVALIECLTVLVTTYLSFQEIETMKAKNLRVPGLAVVLVGERKDSQARINL